MIRPFGGKHPRLAEGVFVEDSAQVIGDVELGEDANVWFGAVVRGDVHYIRIGARTNIQDLTVIHVSEKTHPTVLDEDITVGHRAILHGCHVMRGCLIGMGAVVMDGAKVGHCNQRAVATFHHRERLFGHRGKTVRANIVGDAKSFASNTI